MRPGPFFMSAFLSALMSAPVPASRVRGADASRPGAGAVPGVFRMAGTCGPAVHPGAAGRVRSGAGAVPGVFRMAGTCGPAVHPGAAGRVRSGA
ncbi:hypothetical protein BX265_4465 [Streptomyces sp. TLI_235]|nr:hypothetical protein BX265_4465 [Streptomyces sp. TLI_235]